MLTLFSRCPMYRGLVLQSLSLLRNAVTSYPFLSIEFFFKLLKEENLNIEEIIPPQPQVTDRGEGEGGGGGEGEGGGGEGGEGGEGEGEEGEGEKGEGGGGGGEEESEDEREEEEGEREGGKREGGTVCMLMYMNIYKELYPIHLVYFSLLDIEEGFRC